MAARLQEIEVGSRIILTMTIGEHLSYVRERIAAASRQCGRNPSEIMLVVVTKNQPLSSIEEVIGLGATELGENKSQEFVPKYQAIGERARWHFIGHLQKNKVRQIVPFVTLIHSVESVELAEEIDIRAARAGKVQDILLEINISGEHTKYGVRPDSAEAILEQVLRLEHIKVRGLMTMAPFVADEHRLRAHFSGLRQLRDDLNDSFRGDVELTELSMGMTNDYEIAIEEGSTIVRIGTAIFRP